MKIAHFILKGLGSHVRNYVINYRGTALPRGILFLTDDVQLRKDYLYITSEEGLLRFSSNPEAIAESYVFIAGTGEHTVPLSSFEEASCFQTDLDYFDLYNLLADILERMESSSLARISSGCNFADFIHDVISMNLTRADEILTHLRKFPNVNDAEYRILVFEFDDKNPTDTQYSRLINSIQKIFPYSNSAVYFGRVVTMAQSVTKDDDKVVMPQSRMERLVRTCAENNCCCGVSNTTRNWAVIRTNYICACSTLDIGRAMRDDSEERVFLSEKNLVYRMLDVYYRDFKREFRHDSYIYMLHPGVAAIIRHDSVHNTELRKLLYCYLRNERNLTHTAAEMSMHRNTVVYKVKAITDLIEDDLDDPIIRLRVLLSCMMCDYAERAFGIPPTSFPGYFKES